MLKNSLRQSGIYLTIHNSHKFLSVVEISPPQFSLPSCFKEHDLACSKVCLLNVFLLSFSRSETLPSLIPNISSEKERKNVGRPSRCVYSCVHAYKYVIVQSFDVLIPITLTMAELISWSAVIIQPKDATRNLKRGVVFDPEPLFPQQ